MAFDLQSEFGVRDTLLRLLTWPLLTGLLYIFAITSYRLTFHPLAKYPGPLLAKITDLYSVIHAYKGDRHLEFYRIHQRYGKIVRYGPNKISILSNTAFKKIYGFDANVRKSDFYDAFPVTKDAFNTHNVRDRAIHSRKKRVLSHAFSDSAMSRMEKYILEKVEAFCTGIGQDAKSGKEWGPPQNMGDWCKYMAFDVMGELCFGKSFELLEKPDNRFIVDLVNNAAHRHYVCGTLPKIHELGADKIFFSKLASQRKRFQMYSKAQVAQRMKMGDDGDRKDFFHYLLAAKDPETGEGFAIPELWGESNLFLIAGSDTTSTSLAATFFYLVHNPKSLEKATEEVRKTFSDLDSIQSGPELTSCGYLRAALDEAMRMASPVGGILPREVLDGGIDIDGIHLPAGTVVGTAQYSLLHHPEYYPEPFKYKPERWIEGSSPEVTAESVALARSAFCVFSIGPRGCIGKGMAYRELTLSLARALFLYDMRLAPGTHVGEGFVDGEDGRHRPGEYQLRDTFTSWNDGPLVEFKMSR